MGGRKREEEGTDVLYSVEREMRRGKEREEEEGGGIREAALSLPSSSLFPLPA